MLIDNIIHVYNAIWPCSLLKFKNFKRSLNQTWWSIRIECLLSWSKQSGELYTRISFPTEGQREKQNPRKDWKEKQEVSRKRCGSSPFSLPPALCSWGTQHVVCSSLHVLAHFSYVGGIPVPCVLTLYSPITGKTKKTKQNFILIGLLVP